MTNKTEDKTIKGLRSTIIKRRDDISAGKAKIYELRGIIAEQDKDLSAKDELITALRTEVEDQDIEIGQLRADKTELQGEITNLQDQMVLMHEDLKAKDEMITKRDNYIDRLKRREAEDNETAEKAINVLEARQEEIDRLTKEVVRLTNQVTGLLLPTYDAPLREDTDALFQLFNQRTLGPKPTEERINAQTVFDKEPKPAPKKYKLSKRALTAIVEYHDDIINQLTKRIPK